MAMAASLWLPASGATALDVMNGTELLSFCKTIDVTKKAACYGYLLAFVDFRTMAGDSNGRNCDLPAGHEIETLREQIVKKWTKPRSDTLTRPAHSFSISSIRHIRAGDASELAPWPVSVKRVCAARVERRVKRTAVASHPTGDLKVLKTNDPAQALAPNYRRCPDRY